MSFTSRSCTLGEPEVSPLKMASTAPVSSIGAQRGWGRGRAGPLSGSLARSGCGGKGRGRQNSGTPSLSLCTPSR
eukprot:scaffold290604_cov35-Tisochrysis_lutea.AAC.4